MACHHRMLLNFHVPTASFQALSNWFVNCTRCVYVYAFNHLIMLVHMKAKLASAHACVYQEEQEVSELNPQTSLNINY